MRERRREGGKKRGGSHWRSIHRKRRKRITRRSVSGTPKCSNAKKRTDFSHRMICRALLLSSCHWKCRRHYTSLRCLQCRLHLQRKVHGYATMDMYIALASSAAPKSFSQHHSGRQSLHFHTSLFCLASSGALRCPHTDFPTVSSASHLLQAALWLVTGSG